ncbi:MAG TPA: hypothetical protein VGK90_13905 [Rhizomicrobium sp.]|jgi:hypothetical protein
MFRKAILSSVALVLASSTAFALPKNVISFDLHGVKVSVLMGASRGTQQAPLHVPGGPTFNDLDLKYPNGTYIPFVGFTFGSSNNFGSAFTTGAGTGQKIAGFDVALELVSGTGGVTVCLEADTGGVPSGTCMDGTSAYFPNGSLAPWGTLAPTLNVTFPTIKLPSSTQYWIVAAADPDTDIAWNNQDTDFVNQYTFGEVFSGTWASFNGTGYVPALEVIR